MAKYLNTQTGEVVDKPNILTKELDIYKLIEVSTQLVSLVVRLFRKDKRVPAYIDVENVRSWLEIKFNKKGCEVLYECDFPDMGYSWLFSVLALTEKEARQKMYDLLTEKGLI